MRIVYYAHHQGSGHLRHARRLQGLGLAEVVVVGGLGADVQLPPDVDPAAPHQQPAGSPFHWTPHTPRVRRRFDAFHQVLHDVDPDLVMVDVSVEAAVFAHLAGYRVAHRRMPGHREDPAHQLGYATAEQLFAYYPHVLEQDEYAWSSRTSWLGMVADGSPLPSSSVEPGTVVVLSGAGGGGVDATSLARAGRATPSRTWHVLGPAGPATVPLPPNVVLHGWVPDPAPFLARAEVVVCGAGHNTVAAVAATERPLVLAPEPRPHDEQLVFAHQLRRAFGVPLVDDWRTADWPAVLERPGDGRTLAAGLLTDTPTFARRVANFLECALDDDCSRPA